MSYESMEKYTIRGGCYYKIKNIEAVGKYIVATVAVLVEAWIMK